MGKGTPTSPDEPKYAESSTQDAHHMMFGHYWNSTRDVPPSSISQGNKKICNCVNHQASQWPMDHAIIKLPSCTYKCPYCPAFDDELDPVPQAAKVRAHIKRVHVRKESEFPGLTVQPARAANASRTSR
ncbi:hypothetical protein N7457_001830 [Penicillium paradoxum]|uniref:uncharacterized protein n=1 Tax=Penicillium paradoxum TaxID=176176 RepID=UPI002546CA9F|nr:uncharacterized protein N7457_001830 [Penicillium paradoxum]KAJ5795231.1 hypothetical protein N7457_001830 [Penicillium paradoxum]